MGAFALKSEGWFTDGVDWEARGLTPYPSWNPALQTAARLVACARGPMALLLGPDGVVAGNTAFREMVGAAPSEPVDGCSIFDLFPEQAEFFAAALDGASCGEGRRFRHHPLRAAWGRVQAVVWVNVDFVPVTDNRGVVLGVLATFFDATLDVQKWREAAAAEERVRLIGEDTDVVGGWTLDVDRNVVIPDANAVRLLGLSRTAGFEFDVADLMRVVHANDRSRVASTIKTAIDMRSSCRFRYHVASGDGMLRSVTAVATPALKEDGSLDRLIGIVVEDRSETDEALAESRIRFKTLTETLPQIVWSCDGEGNHDYFSVRWSEFTGISAEDITAETWKTLVHPEHQVRVAESWQRSLRTGEPYDIDYRFRHHTGEYRWLRVMALPIRDDSGRITRWCGTSTDVHEAYLVAEERKRLAQELERIAMQDQLTGVLTRRAFLKKSADAMQDPGARGSPVSVLMLDLDHFKRINDEYGHPGGDMVLSVAAKRIQTVIKNGDYFGRLGGEEFAVLLRSCSSEEAMTVAARIRRAVCAEPVSLDAGRSVRVTLSLGVTTGVNGEDTLERLLSIADQALYHAKARGRDQAMFLNASTESVAAV